MKVAIINFPGSNCALDMKLFFEKRNDNVFFIWHKEENIDDFDFQLLVLPGGFAFGDRSYHSATSNYIIDPGSMAIKSPVCKIITDAHKRNIPIIGVCNGFQILIKMNLLPGNLTINDNYKFTCRKVKCLIQNGKYKNQEITIDVANQYGKYTNIENSYKELKDNNQILITYNDDYQELNGSFHNIGGIFNKEKNIVGMMPHFERNLQDNNLLFDCIIDNLFKNIDLELSQSIEELMFSEHISYKSTRKYLKHLYTNNNNIIQGPGENAGIIDLGNDYCLALRIESHNHPTFIDPFNGAATGVGGILRDIFTMGARPIGICDFLRFGNDSNSENLLKRTVDGIANYGNCFGVANVGGNCIIAPMYNKNPLVNVACFGLMKKENIIYGNVLDDNDVLIYVGSKTGVEGVNGASMASQSFDDNMDKEEMKKNIQTGDAFLEKLLCEACLEIAENKLVQGMQDMGAGGVLCASLEVVQRGRSKTQKNFGCVLNVDSIPTKHKMSNCDKLISESQERMLIVSKPENIDQIFNIFKKWDLEYCVIGNVNNTGDFVVKSNKNIIYQKNMNTFENVQQDWPLNNSSKSNNEFWELRIDNNLWETYDTTIGNRTIENNRITNMFNKPKNYSILNIHEINKKLIISWGCDFSSCYDSIIENSFKPLGLVNCLNYGHPNDSIKDLKIFLENLTESCKKYDVPVVGGNVSLYNATNDKSIDPSPILVMVGIS